MNIYILLGHLSEWIGVIAVTMILALNTRFRKRPLIFQYPRREASFAVFIYAFILVLAFVFTITPHAIMQSVSGSMVNVLAPRLLLAGLSLVPFVIALRFRGQPLLSIGWNPKLFSVGMLLGLALAMLTIFLRGKLYLLLGRLDMEQWMALLIWLGISLCEETIFRGYIQPRLSAYWNERSGWLATAVFFTLWNVPRLMLTPETLLFQTAFVFIQGLLLGWITQKCGHVMAPALYRAVSEWLLLL